jgi:hypothetical protein
MTIAACYDLLLECDVPGCDNGEYGARRQAEYTGEFGSNCRKRARKAGWWFDWKNGLCACPPCAKAGHRPTVPYA